MFDQAIIIVAAVIILSGCAAYAWDTWRGHTQPNRVSWALWALAPIIGFFAQLSEGVGLSAIITLSVGLGPILVLLASFANRQAYWKITGFDLACGSVSLLALVLWVITGTGMIAIIFSILADLLAGVPTLIKAYKHPASESANTFLAGVIGTALTATTFKNLDFATVGFPAYLFLINATLVILISFPRFRLSNKAVRP